MDDLTHIDGIGKATAKRLRAENIITFAQIAVLGVERSEQLGIKPEWIEAAATLAQESSLEVSHEVSQGEEQAAASPAPEGLAEVSGETSSGAAGPVPGDAPPAEGPEGTEYDGKPPRPDDQDEGPHAGSPADSGAGDPHKDDAEIEAADLAGKAAAAFAAPPQVKTAVMVTVTVTGPKRGRWRTGRYFDAVPRTFEATADELLRLRDDPLLTVKYV